MVSQLILVNVGVFVFIHLVKLFLFFFNPGNLEGIFSEFVSYLSIPSNTKTLLFRPWTIITHMFLHVGFWHILFNLLWYYWFGTILREFLGNKRILPVYIYGGLAGAALYIVAFNIFPVFEGAVGVSSAMGASAAVLATVVAAATAQPNYTIYLLLLGPVKIKYIAIISVILDVVFLPDGNPGGHIAHLGGAAFGFIFIKQLQKGNDWSRGFNKMIDNLGGLFKKKSKIKVEYKRPVRRSERKDYHVKKKRTNEHQLDTILDKISQSGYDSLSKEEKEFLFKQSRKN